MRKPPFSVSGKKPIVVSSAKCTAACVKKTNTLNQLALIKNKALRVVWLRLIGALVTQVTWVTWCRYIIAYRQFGAKPLPELMQNYYWLDICVSELTTNGLDNGPLPSHHLNQCWIVINWNLKNKLQWNSNRNLYIFIQENAFENDVWKMAVIFSLPQCVKLPIHSMSHKICPWASYQIRKIAGRACAGNVGIVFPATDFKANR